MHSHEQQLGLSNQAWLSLDLLYVLCQLAERGHTVLVSSLLHYPLTHCPKTLLLGMAHIKVIRHDCSLMIYSLNLDFFCLAKHVHPVVADCL